MTSLSAVSGVDLSSQVSVAVAKKALDQMKQEGAAVVGMIRSAGETQRSMQRSAGYGGVGGKVDVYA